MKPLSYFLAIFAFCLCLPILCFAQNDIRVDAIKTFVSPAQDSIYIQGLDNNLIINFEGNLTEGIKYQLLGFDEKEIPNPFPSIRYTNLPGGNFVLRYAPKNSTTFSEIKVTVMEAIWQKWWFWPMIAAYILLIVAVGFYLFFLYNFRQKLKLQAIRNKISADLHDEVGSNLSSIAIFSEVLKKQIKTNPEQVDHVINKIIENSKESVLLMQDTVWALNPQNDTSEKLIKRLINFGTSVLGEKNIAFSHEIKIDPKKLNLDMEGRKNCYLILKEGLNNIAKHSNASLAELNVYQENSSTYFVLKDNGKGFNTDAINDGNGLRNYQERAKESKFEVSVKSEAGLGTVLEVVI